MKNIEDIYPATYLQKGMLIETEKDISNSTYHDVFAYKVKCKFNHQKFEKTWEYLINRHELLRTRFSVQQGEYYSFVYEKKHVDFVTLKNIDVDSVINEECKKKFDWSNEFPYKIIVDLFEDHFVLIFSFHHAIADGWSISILMAEFIENYTTGKEKKEKLPSYGLFAQHESRALEDPKIISFWENYITEDTSSINFSFRKKTVDNDKINSHFVFNDALSKKITKFAKERFVTPDCILLFGYKLLMEYFTNYKIKQIGVVVNNRLAVPGGDNMFGLFLNTIPMSLKELSAPNNILSEKIKLEQYKILPYGKIKSIHKNDCFQCAFNYVEFYVLNHCYDYIVPLSGFEKTNIPFLLTAERIDEDYIVKFSIDSWLIDQSYIQYMFNNYEQILECIVSEKTFCLRDVRQLNHEKKLLPKKSIIDIFKEQANKYADAIAVGIKDKHLTYSELDRESNRVANLLRLKNVARNDIVGLCVDRSIDMIVAIIGILKAGCAYMPIDGNYPINRIQYILKDSKAKMILTAKKFLNKFKEVNSLIIDTNEIRQHSTEYDYLSQSPYSLIYVIYTSGSTGNPKGVMIENNGILNRLLWMGAEYDISPSDNILQKTTFSFDVSVWELFTPLIYGAKLVFLEPNLEKDFEEIDKTIGRNLITLLHFVPSTLIEYLKLPPKNTQIIRHIIASGEALPANAFTQKVRNLYGPTEASIEVSYFNEGSFETPTVPIGKPIQNIQLHILSMNLELLPIGAPGEIHIGGVGLARGYLNKPDLTAEKFIANPFGNGDRLYKTGDLGRYLPDGNIEFLGRIDNQVKIRGFRIELGEIEAAINSCEGVKNSVVLSKNGQLVAYIVGESSVENIKDKISQTLPEYMIPSYFVMIDKIPLTPNGKTDTKLLLTLDTGKRLNIDEYAAPRNEIEEKLCEIWQEVLHIDKVGINDNFFKIGGDSILAIQVLSKARKLKLNFSVKDIFTYQTVAKLSEITDFAVEEIVFEKSSAGDFFDIDMDEELKNAEKFL